MNRLQTREQNRQRLIDAAYAEFIQNGYDGTSIRDIANRADMTSGLVHYYFASKDELLLAVQSNAQQRYHELYKSPGSPSDLKGNLQEICTRVVDNPDWYRWRYELYALGLKRPELRLQVAHVLRDGRSSVCQQLAQYLPESKASDLAGVLIACFDGLALQRLIDDTFDIAKAYDALAAVLENYFMTVIKEDSL